LAQAVYALKGCFFASPGLPLLLKHRAATLAMCKYICAALGLAAILAEAAPKPVVRERHDDAMYINVPISASEASALLREPLVPDVYNGTAWVTILVDGLNHLEYYAPIVGFVNTLTSGWMTKVNLLVRNSVTDAPGYLITSIDFERGITGSVRSTGAIVTQKIPSVVGTYNVARTKDDELHATVSTDDATALTLTGSLVPPTDMQFVDFVVKRTTKYLQMNNGAVTASSEVGPGSSFDTGDVQDIDLQKLESNLLEKRLALRPLSVAGTRAFFQPVYWLVDHENERIDGALKSSGKLVV